MSNSLFVPEHLGLIPDGNRRWSKLHSQGIITGYWTGIKKFIEFAKWSKTAGVKTVTVWALSTENLTNRSKAELKVLLGLYIKAAADKKLVKELQKYNVKLKVVGDLSVLPKKLLLSLRSVEKQTKMCTAMTINLLINYGGRDDFIHSMQQIQKSGKMGKINEETVRENLRTSALPDLDLIVRTSGEMRLSGFMPWQAVYSELYFTDKYWPDFDKRDFDKALSTFSKRQRRFGK